MCKISLKATVEKLDVKPGECLMVTFTDSRGIPDNLEGISDILKECLPEGVKWFFMSDGIKISVVKEA